MERRLLCVAFRSGARLIAVCESDTVLAGAAYFPALDEVLARRKGTRLLVERNAHPGLDHERDRRCDGAHDGRAILAHPERREGWRRLAEAAAISRSWGDCYGYLLVATARADVMVDGIVGPWDSAPLYPAITEAGGVFTDWEGTDTAFGTSIVATNGVLAATARELLGRQQPTR